MTDNPLISRYKKNQEYSCRNGAGRSILVSGNGVATLPNPRLDRQNSRGKVSLKMMLRPRDAADFCQALFTGRISACAGRADAGPYPFLLWTAAATTPTFFILHNWLSHGFTTANAPVVVITSL